MKIRTTRSIVATSIALCASLAAIPSSQAATTPASFQVSATVVSACLASATTLNFGSNIDPTVATLPIDATTTMTVICTGSTTYAVAFNAGLNAGGASAFTNRMVKTGTHTLGYQLYTDTNRSTVWGDGTASSTVSGTGTGTTQTLTIYGRMPSLTGAVPGTYTDTVTVTVTY